MKSNLPQWKMRRQFGSQPEVCPGGHLVLERQKANSYQFGLLLFFACIGLVGVRFAEAVEADRGASTSKYLSNSAPPGLAAPASGFLRGHGPTLTRVWQTNSVSISGLCHALIFYGLGPTDLPGFPSGLDVLKTLTDEDADVRTFGRSPFVRTRHGLRYYLSQDPLSPTAFGESHRDQCLATLIAMDLPLTTPIHLHMGSLSIADLVSESVANFSFEQGEMAWTAMAYARLLPPKVDWVNRFGERTSFSQLTRYLISRNRHLESCAGTHIFQALACLDHADRIYHLLDSETRQCLATYLRMVLQEAVARQQPDGSWGKTWCHLITNDQVAPLTPFANRIPVTGHIYEAFGVLDTCWQPAAEVSQRAAAWLKASLASPEIRSGGDWLCPFTHAARAARKLSQ
jgi:hypothetical protein